MENSKFLSSDKHICYDDNTIKQLFKQYYTSLVLFAGTYVRNPDVAKDIVQDVFFTLIEKQEKFESIDNLKMYLYCSVKNKCLKYIRHEDIKERYLHYVTTNEEQEVVYQERILEEEIFVQLNQAIQELPAQCRKVFLLALEGKSNAEIAEIIGLGIETVKSHKKAGKKILYNKLKDIAGCSAIAFYLTFL